MSYHPVTYQIIQLKSFKCFKNIIHLKDGVLETESSSCFSN